MNPCQSLGHVEHPPVSEVGCRPSAPRHLPIRQQILRTLELLPTELLQHLSETLPASSAAALALCSHRSCSALGSKYWTRLNDDDQRAEKIAFVALLEPTFPTDIVLCERCVKLHRPCRRHIKGQRNRKPGSSRCDEEGQSDGLHGKVHFNTVQSVMKKHRHGLDTSQEFRDLSIGWPLLLGFQNELDTVEARVVNGELLLRTQFPKLVETEEDLRGGFTTWSICPHQDLWFSTLGVRDSYMAPTARVLACRLRHLGSDRSGCICCEGYWQCSFCQSEYRVDVKRLESSRMAIALTAWPNVGEARTLADPNWKKHTIFDGTLRQEGLCRTDTLCVAMGNVRRDFEAHGGSVPADEELESTQMETRALKTA